MLNSLHQWADGSVITIYYRKLAKSLGKDLQITRSKGVTTISDGEKSVDVRCDGTVVISEVEEAIRRF